MHRTDFLCAPYVRVSEFDCVFISFSIYLDLVPGQKVIFLVIFFVLPLIGSAVVVGATAAEVNDVFSSFDVLFAVSLPVFFLIGTVVGVLQQMAHIFVFASFVKVQNSHSHSKLGVFGGGPSGTWVSTSSVAPFSSTTVGATFGSVSRFFAFVAITFVPPFSFVLRFASLPAVDFGFQKSLELSSSDDCCAATFSRIFAWTNARVPTSVSDSCVESERKRCAFER